MLKNSSIKKNTEPFSLYLTKAYASFQEDTHVDVKLIRKFFTKNLFDQFDPFFLPERLPCENIKQSVPYPEHNLFIWCVLFNQFELAKVFWSIARDVCEFSKYRYG